MPAVDVLERLSACGVRLVRDGEALVAIPKQALNDELRALIRANKPDLLRALERDQNLPRTALDERAIEVRRLIQEIATFAPDYWTEADVEDAVAIATTDLDNALTTFRVLVEQYRRAH